MSRVSVDGLRHYNTPYGPAPSVTTILEVTSPPEKQEVLENWRKRIGYEEAARETEQAAALGTIMHNTLESMIHRIELDEKPNFIYRLGIMMGSKIYDNEVRHMQDIWGVEVPVHYHGLYAGTIDLVGLSPDGVPTIYDFKTAKQMKKREWIGDYFLQGSAYTLAHNTLPGFDQIERVSILMCDRDLHYKKFSIDTEELESYSLEWARRVDQYYQLNTQQ